MFSHDVRFGGRVGPIMQTDARNSTKTLTVLINRKDKSLCGCRRHNDVLQVTEDDENKWTGADE